MIEIVCQGKSLGEAKTKCLAAEILLTQKEISTDIAINILNAIGGICKAESEERDDRNIQNWNEL